MANSSKGAKDKRVSYLLKVNNSKKEASQTIICPVKIVFLPYFTKEWLLFVPSCPGKRVETSTQGTWRNETKFGSFLLRRDALPEILIQNIVGFIFVNRRVTKRAISSPSSVVPWFPHYLFFSQKQSKNFQHFVSPPFYCLKLIKSIIFPMCLIFIKTTHFYLNSGFLCAKKNLSFCVSF